MGGCEGGRKGRRGRSKRGKSAAEQAAYPSSLLHHLSSPTCFFHGGATGRGGAGMGGADGLWKESIQALGVWLLSGRIKKVGRQTWPRRP